MAFKRAKNILAQAPDAAAVDPALFEDDAERALLRRGRAPRAGPTAAYEDAPARAWRRCAPRSDRFFDDVLVMAEDPRVRANRLALLRQALSLFYRIADISRLGGTA